MVYVLLKEYDIMSWDDYEITVIGIFDTREKCEQAKNKCESKKEKYINYIIEEWEINKLKNF